MTTNKKETKIISKDYYAKKVLGEKQMKNARRKIVIFIITILIASFLGLKLYINFYETSETTETSAQKVNTVTLGKNNSNITIENDIIIEVHYLRNYCVCYRV